MAERRDASILFTDLRGFARLSSELDPQALPGLPPVAIGMAVASGQILFGTVGAGGRLEYTVIGDAVNLAAELENTTISRQARR